MSADPAANDGGAGKGNGGSSLRAVLKLLVVLVPVVAVVTVGFLLYYDWRWDSLASRHYRALASVASQLTETLPGFDRSFDDVGKQFAKYGCTSEEYDDICAGPTLEEIPRLVVIPDSDDFIPDHVPVKGVKRTGSLRTALVPEGQGSLAYYLSYQKRPKKTDAKGKANETAPSGGATAPPPANAPPVADPAPAADAASDATWICKTDDVGLCTRLDVGRVIEQLLEADAIEGDVLLASVEGKVYFQRYGNRYLIHDLAKLSGHCDEPLTGNPFSSSDEPRKQERSGELTPGRVDEVCFRNQKHALVVAPIQLQLEAKGDSPPQLVLVSLTPIATWAGAASAVPPLWPAVVALVVMLIALSWPVLKIWTMGQRERLSDTDIRILVLSAIFFSALVTLVVCDFGLHDAIVDSFDAQMEKLAGDVEERFRAELEGAQGFLAAFAKSGEPPPQGQFTAFNDAVLVNANGEPTHRWSAQMDETSGRRQVLKRPKPRFGLADRKYFKQAIAGPWWSLGASPEAGAASARVAVEAVRSRLTTEFAVVLARSLPKGNGIALVAIPMTSLDQPVLPPGLSFAIVDEAGLVQIHSTSAKNLGENLLEECDRNSELATALDARRSDWLSGSCYRLQQRIFVEPIAGTPWSIVVLREKGLFQTVYFDVAMVWLVLFAIYMLCFLLLLLVLEIFKDGYRAPWLWPRRSHPLRYFLASICLAIAAVFGVWSTSLLGATGVIVLIVAVPAASTALLCLALRDPGQPGEKRLAASVATIAAVAILAAALREGECKVALAWIAVLALWLAPCSASTGSSWFLRHEKSFRFSYSVMLLAYLSVLAIMPALVFYRDARDYAVTAFIRHGQLAFQEARVERAERIRARLFAERHSSALTEKLIAERLNPEANGPEPGVFATSWLRWAAPARQPTCDQAGDPPLLSNLVLDGIPSYNDAAAEVRRAACEGASDGAWSWTPGRDKRGLELAIRDPGIIATLGSTQAAAIPPADPDAKEEDPLAPAARDVVAIVVGGFALLIGLAIVWAIARLVFLLGVDRHDSVGSGGPSADASRHLPNLFLFSAREATGGLPPTAIDLRQLEKEDDLRSIRDDPRIKAASYADVHHLEAGLTSPSRAMATLHGLSHARDAGKVLRLFSEVDPIAYMEERLANVTGEGKGEADEERPVWNDQILRSWSSFLALFRREVIAADGAPAELYQSMQLREGAGNDDHALAGRNATLWHNSSEAEKLALRQLADEGFLSPANQDVAHSLMERGLLYRGPAFELLDESFRSFVLRAMSAEKCRALEKDAEGVSAWSRLKGPLALLLALVAAVVMVTQQETFYTTIGIASAVAAALPRIIGLFGRLGEESSARS